MGVRFESESEVVKAAARFLTQRALGHSHKPFLQFRNAPDITVTTAGGKPYDMTVYIPLPHLHAADVSTEGVKYVLSPCIPAHTNLEVKIHPEPDEV